MGCLLGCANSATGRRTRGSFDHEISARRPIYLLSQGTKRYGQLQREIDGISQKMLTQTLRNLEEDGLVRRVVYPEVPPRTEYSLTPLGETLRQPLGSLCEWAETHIAEVEKARMATARRVAKC
jgi:DNA-binding HxlR family transcriptional regulator